MWSGAAGDKLSASPNRPPAPQFARHDRLTAFLKTTAGPPVYWAPKQHSHVTAALQDKQRQELQLWKARQGGPTLGQASGGDRRAGAGQGV